MSALSQHVVEINSKALNKDEKKEASVPLNGHVKTAVEHYFDDLDGHMPEDLYRMVLSEMERPLFETVLQRCGSNLSLASRVLGINRATLRKKLCQYGIPH